MREITSHVTKIGQEAVRIFYREDAGQYEFEKKDGMRIVVDFALTPEVEMIAILKDSLQERGNKMQSAELQMAALHLQNALQTLRKARITGSAP